jgi:hypothetical protein
MSNVISIRASRDLPPSVEVSQNLLEAAKRIGAAAHGMRRVGSPEACAEALGSLIQAATLVQSVAKLLEGALLDGVE